MDDYTEEMIESNIRISDKELIRLLFFRFGVDSKKFIDSIEYADEEVIHDFIVSMMLSEETNKLIHYLNL